MTSKEFSKAIENLNELYNPITPNLSPFKVHLSTYVKNKRLLVELRKIWSVDLNNPEDSNKLFVKKLLTIGFSEKPIVAEVSIDCKDVFRQRMKLKQEGLL